MVNDFQRDNQNETVTSLVNNWHDVDAWLNGDKLNEPYGDCANELTYAIWFSQGGTLTISARRQTNIADQWDD